MSEIKQEQSEFIKLELQQIARDFGIQINHYKPVILLILFLKYISDAWVDQSNEQSEKKFILPEGTDFYSLFEKGRKNKSDYFKLFQRACWEIETRNDSKLQGVLTRLTDNVHNLADEALARLFELFHRPIFDMRPSHVDDSYSGDMFEHVFNELVTNDRMRDDGVYTPNSISQLLANLLQPKSGEIICDPVCGIGSLLIKSAHYIGSADYQIYGQEAHPITWALCMINLYMHNILVTPETIKWGDTLQNPLTADSSSKSTLMKFNVIVGDIPFGLNYNSEIIRNDPYNRFYRGITKKIIPRVNADYAFISHMVETMLPDSFQNGRVGILAPIGVLFKEGSDGVIRQKLVEENLLDAVIGLPNNLFPDVMIYTCILIFKRNKQDKKVLFIDASREFERGRIQNQLRDVDIDKISQSYHNRQNVDSYAYLADLDEIHKNEYNLNIARYVFPYDSPEDKIIISKGKGQHDVFISYSRKDSEKKGEIVESLLKKGMRVWDDKEAYTLEVGTPNWQIEIERAIESSSCVVILLSPNAKKSEWVLNEVMYAKVHHKPIYPVLIEGDTQSSIPLILINYQHVNLQQEQRKQIEDLIESLQELLGVRSVRSPYIHPEQIIKRYPSWQVLVCHNR